MKKLMSILVGLLLIITSCSEFSHVEHGLFKIVAIEAKINNESGKGTYVYRASPVNGAGDIWFTGLYKDYKIGDYIKFCKVLNNKGDQN